MQYSYYRIYCCKINLILVCNQSYELYAILLQFYWKGLCTMLTNLQKKTAQAIINLFETGSAQGDYGNVTLLPGDPGHLTYGRSQTTLGSGNLYLLIKAYVEAPHAKYAAQLKPYLNRLAAQDFALDNDNKLKATLRQAGDDPVMQTVQDAFFDRVYWMPSLADADKASLPLPLSVAVVYDSRVHGSWRAMRDRTNKRHGTVANIGEMAWVIHYVATRREWLANHSIPILRKTVYRMDTFQALLQQKKWRLELPMTVRGVVLSEETLGSEAVRPISADENPSRILKLTNPYMKGDDVGALQKALKDRGAPVLVTKSFDKATDKAVRAFQEGAGLTADGVVGPATRVKLDLD